MPIITGPTAATSAPTANTLVARDSAGRAQVADPAAAQDLANQRYVNVRNANVPVWAGSAVRSNLFDARRHVYNWKGSNTRKLRRGLAYAARGGRTDWVAVGDSGTAGCVSVIGTALFDRLNAWPLAMRNALAGMGVPVGGTGLMRALDGPSYADTQRWVFTGAWTNNASSGSTTAVGATATVTPDVGGSIVEVFYYAYSGGGTFTVAVNGATSGVGFLTVNTNNGGAGVWTKVRLPGLTVTGGTSKIVITCTVAGSGIYVKGANVFTPDGGLVVHNLAQSGSTASGTGNASWTDPGTTGIGTVMKDAAGVARTVTDAAFTSGSNVMTSATAAFTAADVGSPVDVIADPALGPVIPENSYIGSLNSATSVNLLTINLATGATVNATAYRSATAQSATIDRGPSVVHIQLGWNDLNALAATPATITAAITTIRNWWPNADVVLHLMQEGSYSYVSQANQDALAAALYDLADTLDCPLFDWRDRLGRFATALANNIYGDAVIHMTATSQAMVGSLLAEIIGESSGPTQSFQAPLAPQDLANKAYVDRNHRGKYAERVYARTNWR